jgi:hydroxyacylglutathione hydrolase
MRVQMFTVGSFLTNCYVAACEKTKEAIIIDPGFDSKREAEKIFGFLKVNALSLKFIVNTHGHPDHTYGNLMVKKIFAVPVLIHEYDAYMLGENSRGIARFFGFQSFSPPADMLLHDGETIKFGKATLKILHTPGHSRGSMSLIGEKDVFTGDTLFAGSVGRTDFPESSEHDIMISLRNKLATLPDYFIVYPGHGPTTTIGEEKRSNPFLR